MGHLMVKQLFHLDHFFKPTLRDNKTKYLNKLKFGVKKILKGESSVREILEGIGEIVSEDIKKAIKK